MKDEEERIRIAESRNEEKERARHVFLPHRCPHCDGEGGLHRPGCAFEACANRPNTVAKEHKYPPHRPATTLTFEQHVQAISAAHQDQIHRAMFFENRIKQLADDVHVLKKSLASSEKARFDISKELESLRKEHDSSKIKLLAEAKRADNMQHRAQQDAQAYESTEKARQELEKDLAAATKRVAELDVICSDRGLELDKMHHAVAKSAGEAAKFFAQTKELDKIVEYWKSQAETNKTDRQHLDRTQTECENLREIIDHTKRALNDANSKLADAKSTFKGINFILWVLMICVVGYSSVCIIAHFR